jgi:hypothetical protein
MPTATLAVEWKREAAQPEELTKEKEQVVAWEDAVGRSSARAVRVAQRGLEAEIERSKQILTLQAELASGGTTVYSEDTLHRSIAFLVAHSEWLRRSCGLKLPTPAIGIGPNGSVDLYWKEPTRQLLINMPAKADELATFYGNYGIQKIRGSFDLRKLQYSIAAWLAM